MSDDDEKVEKDNEGKKKGMSVHVDSVRKIRRMLTPYRGTIRIRSQKKKGKKIGDRGMLSSKIAG